MIVFMPTEESATPDAFWHYTDAAGLIGILESGTFHASSTQFMNDTREIILGTELMSDRFAGRQKELSLRTQKAVTDWEKFRREAAGRMLHTFLFCASKDGDSLAMWRGYGTGAVGYAVGIDRNFQFSHKHPDFWDSELSWLDVEYDPAGHESLVDMCFASLDSKPRLSADSFQADLNSSVDEMEIEETVFRIKDKAFREEREVRLIVPVRQTHLSQIHHRPSRFGVVPYIRIGAGQEQGADADKATSLPVVHIRIGPTSYPEQAELAARSLAAKNGYRQIGISHSQATFR